MGTLLDKQQCSDIVLIDKNVYSPPSPLHSNRLHVTVSSHPQGNIPQVTVPSLTLITMQRTCDTKQDMQTQGHMNHKMSQKLPIGIHV